MADPADNFDDFYAGPRLIISGMTAGPRLDAQLFAGTTLQASSSASASSPSSSPSSSGSPLVSSSSGSSVSSPSSSGSPSSASSSSGGVWNPADYGTPIWWMDAAQGVEKSAGVPAVDGDAVLNWLDQSASGMDFSQATSTDKPHLWATAFNGKPTLRFDGISDRLTAGGNIGNFTAVTLAYVVKLNATSSGINSQYLHAYANSAGTRHFGLWETNDGDYRFELWAPFASVVSVSPISALLRTVILVTAIENGDLIITFDNGQESLSQTSSGLSTFIGQSGISVVLGESYDQTRPANVDIAEIVAWGSVLSSADQSTVIATLKAKYGIT